jgi:hypothetical protein
MNKSVDDVLEENEGAAVRAAPLTVLCVDDIYCATRRGRVVCVDGWSSSLMCTQHAGTPTHALTLTLTLTRAHMHPHTSFRSPGTFILALFTFPATPSR